MTSTLTLYKNCELTPEHNYIIDNVDANYLVDLDKLVINNFQHIKHGLDLKIKVDLPQTEVSSPSYNYATIKNEDDTRTFYYFITNVEWKAQSTVNLTLSIDSLTTFKDKFTSANWDSRTKILREHQDRFANVNINPTQAFSALRKVDYEDEGLTGVNTYKYFKEKIISDGEGRTTNPDPSKTYLIYATDTEDENSAVSCYVTSDNSFEISGGTGTGILYPTEDLDINTMYVFTNYPGQTSFYVSPSYASESLFECSSTTSYILVYGKFMTESTSGTAWNLYKIGDGGGRWDFLSNQDYIRFFQHTEWLQESLPPFEDGDYATTRMNGSLIGHHTNTSNWPQMIESLYSFSEYKGYTDGGHTWVTINGLNDWNLTDPRIIKIIDCPYWLGGNVANVLSSGKWKWITKDFANGRSISCLKLDTDIVNTELTNLIKDNYALDYFNITIPDKASRFMAQRNKNYESKMYHSSIFKNTYVYDSFVYEIRPEDVTTLVNPTLDLKYVQSSNISSRCLFDFTLTPSTYKEYGSFDNILSCDRNNEHPIYNSEYLNYIKNGYNYDKKAKDMQNIGSWIGTGLQIVGGIAGLAASSVTGGVSAAAGISLLTSATASIAKNIMSDVKAEQSMNQKLNELRNKSTSVNTSDDLSLLNYYCDNKMWRFDYKPSTRVENSIYDLFFRTGYAFNSTGVPLTNSRRSFNYVQCEPIFRDEENPDWLMYLDDVKSRFKAGVTYMHRFQIEENGDWIYDFNFIYENWERFICPRSY